MPVIEYTNPTRNTPEVQELINHRVHETDIVLLAPNHIIYGESVNRAVADLAKHLGIEWEQPKFTSSCGVSRALREEAAKMLGLWSASDVQLAYQREYWGNY